jgi:hypothetical protein
MRTGHVGAEYVEYGHKRRLTPQAAPLRLGRPELDAPNFGEPDLTVSTWCMPFVTRKTKAACAAPSSVESATLASLKSTAFLRHHAASHGKAVGAFADKLLERADTRRRQRASQSNSVPLAKYLQPVTQ